MYLIVNTEYWHKLLGMTLYSFTHKSAVLSYGDSQVS